MVVVMVVAVRARAATGGVGDLNTGCCERRIIGAERGVGERQAVDDEENEAS